MAGWRSLLGGGALTLWLVVVAPMAQAVSLIRDADLEALLAQHFGARLRPEHLRMADIPEGSVLLWGTGPMRW